MSMETFLDAITMGDALELSRDIPDESIDLVFCDPPYLKCHIEAGVYSWLAETAARVLKPGGFCIAYCGTYWLYKAMLQMGQHLAYFWEYRILFREGYAAGLHWGRRTKPGCTPLLAFQKPPHAGIALPQRTVLDVYKGAGADKSFHRWGQDAYSAQYYLECFSRPGDLVFDPFCGGGTVPYVCKQLARHFIAFEIDPVTADVARKRLQTVQSVLFSEARIEQMPLEGVSA